MSDSLQVRISTRTVDETVRYEGTVSLPGIRPTKLTRKNDGTTQFGTRAALASAARAFAHTLGYETVEFETTASAKAAKRSTKNDDGSATGVYA